jgi:uncharacterized surface protein with fasciclin (FAS1) repeats
MDTLTADREFSRFVNGLVNTHLVQDFRQARDITIFAPTNNGLQRMNAVVIDRLFPRDEGGSRQADPVLAPAAVGAHVVQGRHSAAELARGQQFTAVSGTPLSTSGAGGTVTVSGAGGTQARVTRADIACSNGVIHGIDAPLIR